ncbi:MAG: cytochrome c [Chloroflexi bacterium]|nr:cytochrome c [Chloroflexota bacterium]
MRWYYLLIVSLLWLAAGCGAVAMPRYQADAMLNSARNTATAIVGQAYTEVFASPTPTATATHTATATPTATDTATPTKTALPTQTFTAMPTETATASGSADAPADAAERAAAGDVVQGQELFNRFQPAASFACATCHRVDSEARLIGPGLLNVGMRAETRIASLNAAQYLYQSITNPSAYVIEGFPDMLMPRNWAEIYSEDEIYSIVAYLLTLQTE